MNINEIIKNKIEEDFFTDTQIQEMAYELRNFNARVAGMKKSEILWWSGNGILYKSRLTEIESAFTSSPEKVEMVKCSCGCTVAKISVMSASLGTSCPTCYDDMSG
jgi:hypothetical protein